MGMYVNPGNEAFAEIDDADYIDKTGLIPNRERRINPGWRTLQNTSPRFFSNGLLHRHLAGRGFLAVLGRNCNHCPIRTLFFR